MQNMHSAERVILLACSLRKIPAVGPTQAWRLYDGTLWRTLRAARKEADRAKKRPPYAIALSARHGFIGEEKSIEPYNLVLTPLRAAEILERADLMAGLRVRDVGVVLIAGGALYRQTMRAGLERVGFRGHIQEPASPRGIGDLAEAVRVFVEQSPRIGELALPPPDTLEMVIERGSGLPIKARWKA